MLDKSENILLKIWIYNVWSLLCLVALEVFWVKYLLYCNSMCQRSVIVTYSMRNFIIKSSLGTSLVVQWLRIHLPMQGTRVQSLVREDLTCRGATKPMCHNSWSPCSATREATALGRPQTAMKSWPPLTTVGESSRAAMGPNAVKSHQINT